MFFYYKYTYIYNFMKKILLFIPCFNCQKQIIRVLNSLDDKIIDTFEQILIIDNRSNDNTQKVIREFLENADANIGTQLESFIEEIGNIGIQKKMELTCVPCSEDLPEGEEYTFESFVNFNTVNFFTAS